MAREIVDADWHRNGSGGNAFYVAIVKEDDSRKLIIAFETDETGMVAVLDLDEAARGNIFMHPQPGEPGMGGNAWRGDHYWDTAEEIKAKVHPPKKN